MRAASDSPTLGARLAGASGGAVFLVSLAYAGYSYVVRFDAAPASPVEDGLAAALVNVALFSAFALHHSLLIRAGVKQRVAAIVGSHLERTVYVSVASVLFLLVCAAWRPVPGVVWSASPPWSVGLIGLQLAGVALTVRAASGIDLLELAGVRQAWGEGPRGPARLTTTGAYRFVRHPIYFGWLLMVWPAPEMTGTRLVFAAASTLYLIVAIPFEERDLRRALGADYAAYQRRVRWRLLPFVF